MHFSLSVSEWRAALARAEFRRRLVESASNAHYASKGVRPNREPGYRNMHVVKSAFMPNPAVEQVAAERHFHPVEAILELALETNFEQLNDLPTGGHHHRRQAGVRERRTHRRARGPAAAFFTLGCAMKAGA